MRRLLRYCAITSQTTILDVGGVPDFWDSILGAPFIVLLNLEPPTGELGRAACAVVGDGRRLPFPDSSFDIVVSNSAIEHVGSPHAQELFAREVQRVGRSYWVQTPNLWFPLEQHLFLPFIHWLPKRWQAPVVRRFTLWSVMRAPQSHRDFFVAHYLQDIRLLSASELRKLFPSSLILRESFLGLTKSLIAVTRRGSLPSKADSTQSPAASQTAP